MRGRSAINSYALSLREILNPELGYGQALWLTRIILLTCAILHIVAATQLTRLNWRARPVGYTSKKNVATTWAAQTMRWGGVLLAVFIVFHILHFTLGAVGFQPGQFVDLMVYQNVVAGFSVWPIAVFYIIAMVALGLHLDHGIWSALQTLGWTTRAKYSRPAASFADHRAHRVSWIQLGANRCTSRLGEVTGKEMLESNIPEGPIENKWDEARFHYKLVNPANRRKHSLIIVGSGLAGAAAAASFGQQGYAVKCFSFHDSPRRAHSIAAQGGINAAKNYRNDGDSIMRLFYDTVKGGDFRAREGNVYRLAQISANIIDQCVAQGVPVRPRIRRPAGYALIRRRAGFSYVLRSRTDGAAIAAWRLPGAGRADRRRQREDAHAQRRAGRRDRQWKSARHHYA